MELRIGMVRDTRASVFILESQLPMGWLWLVGSIKL